MLTVKKLIKQLQAIEDQDRVVVMSKDGEGNGYSPLADFYEAAYLADSTWSGEVGIEALTEELEEDGFSEEDVMPPNAKPCIVLSPTN